jgi:hypothetical protein
MIIEKEKGVSLIITFFIMMIVLAIVLSISVLLYSGIKVIRNMGNSVISYYAAESGVEKVLYYDRQVLSILSTDGLCTLDSDCSPGQICSDSLCTTFGDRGLCAILTNCTTGNNIEKSIYCTPVTLCSGNENCDDTCSNCNICFTTILDDKTYSTTASVLDGNYYLDIKSSGFFNGTSRQIETKIETQIDPIIEAEKKAKKAK